MRRFISVATCGAALAGVAGGAVILWRRNPRVGTRAMNSVVDPWLLRRGLAGGAVSELGTLEHIGRRSGIRRLTPVHPEPTATGFRIVVPLGGRSEWARNVLAAGHCRLQLHELVHDLDEPRLVPASSATDLPRGVRALMSVLGFQYLELRTFGTRPDVLDPVETEATTPAASTRTPPVPEPATAG